MTSEHSFLSRLLGRRRRPTVVPENLLTVVVIAHLNVRTIPEDRTRYYGDSLDDVLAAKSLGEVTDGGTTFDTEGGRINYAYLEIGLQDSSDETFGLIIDALEELGAPAGSYLEVLAQKQKIAFGHYEGLALAIPRANLRRPDDPSDEINELLTDLELALGDLGAFRGYWEGQNDCELYFYGPSFDPIRAKIAEVAIKRSALANCRTIQIA